MISGGFLVTTRRGGAATAVANGEG